MKKTKTTTITEVVVVKEGVSDKGRDWCLYQVTDADGVKYKTFAHRYTSLAGTMLTLNYEEAEVPSKDGTRKFLNRTLIEPGEMRSPTPKSAGMPANQEEMMTILRRLDIRVAELVDMVILNSKDKTLPRLNEYEEPPF